MIPAVDVKEFSYKDYINVVLKRLKMVFNIFLATAIFVALYFFLSPKMYTSEATVQLTKNPLELAAPKDSPYRKDTGGIYRTQLEILSSSFIAERVVKKLDLKLAPEELQRIVMIQPLMGTTMVVIAVKGPDAQLNTEVVNTWVNEFIQRDIEIESGVAEYGAGKLEEEINDILKKLKVSETKIKEFVDTHGEFKAQQEAYEKLKERKEKLELAILNDSLKYGEKHQKITSLREQLAEVTAQLSVEEKRFEDVKEIMAEYDVLSKRRDAYKTLYEEFVWKVESLNTLQGLAVSDIKIIDYAKVPERPDLPLTVPNVIFILSGSLVFGIALCFYLEYKDRTLKTAEEVEFYVKTPFLGYIPKISEKSEKERCLLAYENNNSFGAEAFRNLKVSLIFASPEEKPANTIMVSSAVPKEGKTLVASNLAVTFANGRSKTLLIDANIRMGGISDVFGIKKNMKGLSDLLLENAQIEEAIVETKVPNLYVMPTGKFMSNLVDAINIDKFTKLISKIKKLYDKIVIDVPSILSFTDYLYWAKESDAFIMVIKASATPFDVIDAARGNIDDKVPFIGSVLNRSSLGSDTLYYKHYFKSLTKKD